MMLRKILRLFLDLPGKNTQSAKSASDTGRVVTINSSGLKCMILNDTSVRHFLQIISTILSPFLQIIEDSIPYL